MVKNQSWPNQNFDQTIEAKPIMVKQNLTKPNMVIPNLGQTKYSQTNLSQTKHGKTNLSQTKHSQTNLSSTQTQHGQSEPGPTFWAKLNLAKQNIVKPILVQTNLSSNQS